MSIGSALKGLGKAVKNPANVAKVTTGGLVTLIGANAIDNVTTPSTASPVIVVNSETPTPSGKASTASEGTYDWVTAMMLLNGTGGFNGSGGLGGNGNDNPRLNNPRVTGGIPIIPILIGIAVIGVIIYVITRKKKRGGRK